VEGLYIIPCSGPPESLAVVVISPLFWWLALAIVVRSPQLEAIARPGFCDTLPSSPALQTPGSQEELVAGQLAGYSLWDQWFVGVGVSGWCGPGALDKGGLFV